MFPSATDVFCNVLHSDGSRLCFFLFGLLADFLLSFRHDCVCITRSSRVAHKITEIKEGESLRVQCWLYDALSTINTIL